MSLHNSTIENQYWTILIVRTCKAKAGGMNAEHVRRTSTRGQAKKSARGMPWHQEPMKDVISCDKLRGGANILRSGDFRMGKPTREGIIQ